MNISAVFNEFLGNLVINNKEEISGRYINITKALNKKYYNIDSGTLNSYQVGSYGRKTAVKGISDLDMIFILPPEEFKRFNSYSGNGQSALLQEVKTTISMTYSKTNIRGDGQVVVVRFKNYIIEVCPVFQLPDGSFKYPDSNNDGSWKITNPIPEIKELHDYNQITNSNLKKLMKMARAWKNKCGVKIGGLLIDTLCYEFFKKNEKYHTSTYSNYDLLLKDFFEFLKNYDTDRVYWLAPGSNQKVYKKKSNFISKAKKAYVNVVDAIEKNENNTVYTIWKKVFGYPFPYPQSIKESDLNYTPKEEFIEDICPVDISNNLRIECEVKQDGFRTELLRKIGVLKVNKKLKFYIENTDVEKPYIVKWKVKNEGVVAKAQNNLRGQILDDFGEEIRNENTNFVGSHFVECYIIKNDICVARDRIEVPISN